MELHNLPYRTHPLTRLFRPRPLAAIQARAARPGYRGLIPKIAPPKPCGGKFAVDSPLEGTGFEPLVPLTDGVAFRNTFCRPELPCLKADPFRPEGSGRRIEFHFPPPRLCCEPGREPGAESEANVLRP